MTELRLCLRWKEIFGDVRGARKEMPSTLEAPAEISEDRYNSKRDRCRVYIHVNLHVEYIYPRHTNTHMYTLHRLEQAYVGTYMIKITPRTSPQPQPSQPSGPPPTTYAGTTRAK